MTSMKKLEDKLEKKKIRLQKLLTEKDKLEIKIKELRSDIEKLQANQLLKLKKQSIPTSYLMIHLSIRLIQMMLTKIKSFSVMVCALSKQSEQLRL